MSTNPTHADEDQIYEEVFSITAYDFEKISSKSTGEDVIADIAMRHYKQIIKIIQANYTPNAQVERLVLEARIDENYHHIGRHDICETTKEDFVSRIKDIKTQLTKLNEN